jgi:plasmid maintenance system antidote protein VapI
LWTDHQYWLNLQNIYDIQTLESQNETPNLFQIKERAREFAYA